MPTHPPIVRRPVVTDPEELARRTLGHERIRNSRAAAWDGAAPARTAAILTGPTLVDVDAAVDCHCSCHPRPADLGLHAGGPDCGCQLTPEQRRAQWESWSWPEPTDEQQQRRQAEFAALAAVALELGVDARVELTMCPFVLVGNCDGRGFYLRERHGEWRVTIAGDDDPGDDPWGSTPDGATIDIATGDECELTDDEGWFSEVAALRVAVGCVREALARNACAHLRAIGAYCPACGVSMADEAAWRWSVVPG